MAILPVLWMAEIGFATAGGIRVSFTTTRIDPQGQTLPSRELDARAITIAHFQTIVAGLLGRGPLTHQRPGEDCPGNVIIALAKPHRLGARREDFRHPDL